MNLFVIFICGLILLGISEVSLVIGLASKRARLGFSNAGGQGLEAECLARHARALSLSPQRGCESESQAQAWRKPEDSQGLGRVSGGSPFSFRCADLPIVQILWQPFAACTGSGHAFDSTGLSAIHMPWHLLSHGVPAALYSALVTHPSAFCYMLASFCLLGWYPA